MRPMRKGQSIHRGSLTVVVIAALALLSACSQASGMGHPTPATTATPTPLPAAPLSWQTGTLPLGAPVFGSFNGPVTIAPGDGRTAYALRQPQNSTQAQDPELWVTHDRAAHWTRMADVPAGRPLTFAHLVVDSINSAIVVAVVSWAQSGLGPVPQFSANYATFDGGASWQRLSAPQPFEVQQLATRAGTTFAILNSGPGGGDIRPWVSADRMRTWQPVAGPDAFAIASFWINPASGEMLATVGDPAQLWETPDYGQHWTQLTGPALDPTSLVVGPPVAGQPWRTCGLTPHPSDPTNGGTLMCSLDGGRSWQERPRIHFTESGPKGSFPVVAGLLGVAGDGTLLSSSPDGLYQLAPGASAWQSLGPAPQAPLATAALADGDLLWEWAVSGRNEVSAPYPAGA